jgi:superfamily II DNA/RNA helicase
MACLVLLAQHLFDTGATAPLSAVIISPTRKLASLIEIEARRLLAGSMLSVGIVMGGTNINKDKYALQANLLVAVCMIFVGQSTSLTKYIAGSWSSR